MHAYRLGFRNGTVFIASNIEEIQHISSHCTPILLHEAEDSMIVYGVYTARSKELLYVLRVVGASNEALIC